MRLLLLVGILAAITAYSCAVYEYVRSYHLQPGIEPPLLSPAGRRALFDIAKAAPGRLLDAFRMESIERLYLEIEPRHFRKIAEKRREALQRQLLITSKRDLVPATLIHRGRKLRARVRLKGDLSDHLLGDKWSYRVELRDDGSVLGMSRFSLQAPYTRDYHAEPLFLDFLREQGLLAPRYLFVDLTVNGRRVGRMALEEHFSNELLEHQSRRDGVIVRFDERYFYKAELSFMDLVPDYDNWRNAPLDAFRSKRTEDSEELREQMRTAFGLLRGVALDYLEPSQALDVGQWGRLLAACEIWSMPHMTHWNNLRFYLNPLTLGLEPIGFDASGLSQQVPGLRCAGGAHAMMTRLIEDPKLRAAFLDSLKELSRQVESPEFERWLRQREARYLPPLLGEFPWLRPYPLEKLRQRAHSLRRVSEATYTRYLARVEERVMPHRPGADYPTVVYAYLQHDASGPFLELANAISLPVTVTELWIERMDERGSPLRETRPVYHPLPPTPWPKKPHRLRVDLRGMLPDDRRWTIGGRALVAGQPYTFGAIETAPPLEHPPLPQPALEETLAQHPFLHRDSRAGWVACDPGSFDVEGSLVLPEGVGLHIGPGTTLRFGRRGMLLARGPLEFLGDAASPIALAARDGSWPGVVTLGNNTPIHWSHVVVRNTSSPSVAGWGVTGGVTFHRATVTLENCAFEGSRAEDALNPVGSHLTLRRVEIRGVDSDALDADFCRGRIEGGDVTGAKGDGIDLSGSQIEIEGLQLRDIRDKALSVGEASDVQIRHVRVSGCGTGIASKDQSLTLVEDSTFSGVTHAALMAYVKKPHFGPAVLEARGVRIEDATREAVAQLGSRLSLNGRTVAPEPLDVEALYDSGPMRK